MLRYYIHISFYLICVFLYKSEVILGSIILTQDSFSNNGVTCPLVTFNCTVTDFPFENFRWYFDVMAIANYPHQDTDMYPLNVTLFSPRPDVMIQIVGASRNITNFSYMSTLTANLSILQQEGVNDISCGVINMLSDPITINNIIIRNIDPPSTSFNCSLLVSPGDLGVSFQWPLPANDVERYRVVVTPDPSSSCSSEQVSPSENYSCSRLHLGTHYSFTVSAINCRNQEGPRETFTVHVHPQVPETPVIDVVPIYNKFSELTKVIVQWEDRPVPLISDKCFFEGSLVYRVELKNTSGVTVDEIEIASGCGVCMDNDECPTPLCSTSFGYDDNYSIHVTTYNPFGPSPPAIFDIAIGSIGLTQNSLSNDGVTCPLVTFNCIVTDFPFDSLRWYFNYLTIAAYPYQDFDVFPLNLFSPRPDVMIQIVGASRNVNNFSYMSTLTANLSVLLQEGVNNISCGSTGTMSDPFGVNRRTIRFPQNPASISVVRIIYDANEILTLSIVWNRTSTVLPMAENCVINTDYTYTVILENIIQNTVINSKSISAMSCGQHNCTTSISAPSNESFSLAIRANNAFGESTKLIFPTIIVGLSHYYFNFCIINNITCASYALCSSQLDLDGCRIQYGVDPSYDHLSPPIKGPINSIFPLPYMEASTVYYHQATVNIDSLEVVVRSVHRTEDCTPNERWYQVGLIMCSGLLVILAVLYVILMIKYKKRGKTSKPSTMNLGERSHDRRDTSINEQITYDDIIKTKSKAEVSAQKPGVIKDAVYDEIQDTRCSDGKDSLNVQKNAAYHSTLQKLSA